MAHSVETPATDNNRW